MTQNRGLHPVTNRWDVAGPIWQPQSGNAARADILPEVLPRVHGSEKTGNGQ